MKKLFTEGIILTLEKGQIADSIMIEEGVIVGVGTKKELLGKVDSDCEIIHLNGKTMLPSFIDAHSHVSSYANSFLQVSLAEAKNMQQIVDKLTSFCNEQELKNGQWLIANNYDHNSLLEKKHPTKELLDETFPNFKVVLQHQSGHFGVMNTAALKSLGLEGKDNDGYLKENTWVDAVKNLPLPSAEQLLGAYKKAFERYASYGITTVQDGMMVKQMIPLVQLLLANQAFDLDVVGYPEMHDVDLFYETFSNAADRYQDHFRLGGYKMILDGSPQGRTAWMRTSYKGSVDEYGVSSVSDDEVENALRKAIANHRQILFHCNGDRACEQLLNAAERINDKEGLREIKPVIIHAQFLARDQLSAVKEYGFIPSFFVAHTFYWGDVHIKNVGFERAKEISLAQSAKQKGLLFTFHQDTPVIEPNMFETVWCAVSRQTKSSVVLGEDERITVEDALKAVTINAAMQYSEDDVKGTLAVGKAADFILVEKNPMTCPIDELKELEVLKTYKDGECIFSR